MKSMLSSLLVALVCVTAWGQRGDIKLTALGVKMDAARRSQVVVLEVQKGSEAETAGLLKDDVVVRMDGVTLKGYMHYWREYRRKKLGTTLVLDVLRKDKALKIRIPLQYELTVATILAHGGPKKLGSPRVKRWLDAPEPSYVRLMRDQIAAHRLGEEFDALRHALYEDLYFRRGHHLLDIVEGTLLNPLKFPGAARRLTRRLAGTAPQDLVAACSDVIDAPVASPARERGTVDIEWVKRLFTRTYALRARAFARLTAAEMELLKRTIPTLLTQFIEHVYLQLTESQFINMYRDLLYLTRKVDFQALAAMGAELGKLLDPDVRRRLHESCAGLAPLKPGSVGGVEGTVLYHARTPWGEFVVGGSGPNTYRRRFAFILDLGGDDTYLEQKMDFLKEPVQAILDREGNDTYGNEDHDFSFACGVLGAALLVDEKGKDRYFLRSGGLGFAFLGVGLMVDLGADDDIYWSRHYSQGCAFFGIAVMIDGGGSDKYHSYLYSQGVGGPRAVGLLIDRGGDDLYEIEGRYPSAYETKGVYRGLGQGLGIGFREMAAGGVGILIDEGGNDRYRAGNFAQGCGYFLGIGILVDERGNDHYFGTRFTQGSSAHQALGILIDGAGNDVYIAGVSLHQGNGWDCAVGFLIDHGGNDIYIGSGLAQGCGSQNGIGGLVDLGGRDQYRGRPSSRGWGGENSYGGGRGAGSIAFFIDLASDGDVYVSGPGRENAGHVAGQFGVFLDTPKRLDELLVAGKRPAAAAKRNRRGRD